MGIMAVLSITLVFFGILAGSTPIIRECRTNDDCQEREFCYWANQKNGSGTCSECLNCVALYNQQEPTRCAKSQHECGDCLPGYMQDPNNERVDGRKTCILIKTTDETTTSTATDMPEVDQYMTSIYITVGCIFVVVLLVFVLLTGYFLWKKFRVSDALKSTVGYAVNNNIAPSAPPELQRLHHSNGYFEEVVDEHHMADEKPPAYSPQTTPRTSHEAQNARPYAAPSAYIRPSNVSVDNTDSAAANQDSVQNTDENTQPSAWTPSPSNGERTNFAGILEENANAPPARRENTQGSEPEEPPAKQARNENTITNIFVSINNDVRLQQATVGNTIDMSNTNITHNGRQATSSRVRRPEETDQNSEEQIIEIDEQNSLVRATPSNSD